MKLVDLAAAIFNNENLCNLSLHHLTTLLQVVQLSRPFLEAQTAHLQAPPATFPQHLRCFTALALGGGNEDGIQDLWNVAKGVLWEITSGEGVGVEEGMIAQYNQYCQANGVETCTFS
jgi:hypothetical protein